MRAWALFGEHGLGDVTDDPKVLTLKGRLLKDLADQATGAERAKLYGDAASAYLAAHKLKSDSYPLINAATLALLAADLTQSKTLAQQVLDLIENDPNEGETAYWREATRAEALLLLERRDDAENALKAGIEKLPRAWEDHAATIAQFERILGKREENADWLDPYRPPRAVHFSGLIGLDPQDSELHKAIDRKIADLQPGFAYGALAAGADILLAEALVRSGAQLMITLPCSVEQFRTLSIEPYGGDWQSRFDALIEQAVDVHALDVGANEHACSKAAIELASLVSMGQALRQAATLRTTAVAVTLAAPGEKVRPHIEQWDSSGFPLITIPAIRVREGSSGGQSPSKSTPEIAMSVVVSADDVDRVTDLAQTHQLVFGKGGAASWLVGKPDEMLALLRALNEQCVDAAMAVSIGLSDARAERPSLSPIVRRMGESAQPGSVYCDWQTAMAAKVLDPTIRVEELGELASALGAIPLWSIRL